MFKRKTPKGKTVYYFRTYDEKGNRVTGRSTGKATRKGARDYCEELKAMGRLVNPPVPDEAVKAGEPRTPTLREWVASESWWQWGKCRYLRALPARSDEDKPAVSRRYADDALRDLKAYILPACDEKHLDEITPSDCVRPLFAWQEKGLAKKSINNKSSIERIMLGEAERLGYMAGPGDGDSARGGR